MSSRDSAVLARIHAWSAERAPVLERLVPYGAREGSPVLLLGRRLFGAQVARFGAHSTWALPLSDNAAVAVVPAGAVGESVCLERGGLRSNALAVDGGEPPRIVRADPEDGATGVWLDPVVVLRASHPIDRATVPGAVTIANRPCRVLLSPDRRALVCRPLMRLEPRTTYTVRAGGLADVSGRPLALHVSAFDTGTEAFADA